MYQEKIIRINKAEKEVCFTTFKLLGKLLNFKSDLDAFRSYKQIISLLTEMCSTSARQMHIKHSLKGLQLPTNFNSVLKYF